MACQLLKHVIMPFAIRVMSAIDHTAYFRYRRLPGPRPDASAASGRGAVG